MPRNATRQAKPLIRRFAIVPAVAAPLLAGASVARASIIVGEPFTLIERAQVSARFVSQSAGARGSLYFLGAELGGVVSRAPSSDSNDLGAHLFDNHRSSPGDAIDLGVFDAGATLHFAYLITRGVRVAPTGSLFRTDVAGDLLYVAQHPVDAGEPGVSITRVGVEDIRDIRRSDFDYNDIRFDLVAHAAPSQPIPASGSALTLMALAGALAMPRRRR